MSSHEIKSLILNYDMTDEIIENLINEDFNETILGMYNALFELLMFIKVPLNNILANDIMIEIDDILDNTNELEELKFIESTTKRTISNMYKYFNSDKLKDALTELNILRSIEKKSRGKKNKELEYSKVKLIEDLIYKDKNLKRIKSVINSNNNILNTKDSNNENILYKLLKTYNNLDSNNEYLDYYYQVILLFLHGNYSDDIIDNKDYYLETLTNIDKLHIRQIKDSIEYNDKVLLSDLEKKYHINLLYPKDIELEMYTFTTNKDNVVDLRNQPCITIDGIGSQCLDDALYIEKNIDGTYTLYIHLTYIPAIIPYNSVINEVAKNKVETLFLIDKDYSLYPDYISNYLCSLLNNNTRYTETGIVKLDNKLNVIEDSFKLIKSKINSHYRLTYESADLILGENNNDNLTNTLKLLGNFALKQRRLTCDKEIYRGIENLIHKNPNHESLDVANSVSANIAQESMILFNELKAKYYNFLNLPYIYRCCRRQDSDIIEQELAKILNSNKNIDKRIWESFKKNLIPTYLSGYYSEIPEKHYGLNKDYYSHSTSPARRYVDAFGEYLDEYLLFNNNTTDKDIYTWEFRIKEIVKHLNEKSLNIEAFSNQYNYLKSRKLIKN